MKAIWSRVAKGASRHRRQTCTGTLSTNGFCRRTVASVGSPRRKPRLSEIFTAFYTSIMGTAAVVDARAKDERTREIDRQISEAKAELAQLVERAPKYDPDYDRNKTIAKQAAENRALGNHLAKICIAPDRLRRSGRIASIRRDFVAGHLSDTPVVGRIMASGSLSRTNFERILEDLLQEESDPSLPQRECKSDIQLNAMREETLLFAESLLAAACHMPDPDTGTSEQEREMQAHRLQIILNDFAKAREESYPRLGYTLVYPYRSLECRRALNEISRHLLTYSALEHPHETISKLGYNILVSPFPLSIHNYNTMLLGFTRLGWYSLGDVVIESLYRTKLIRTKQTTVCLLHHYRLKSDILGFYRVIAELVAAVPSGAMVRRKKREELGIPFLTLWAIYSDVVAHPKHITERVARDSSVLEAIIQGTLHFGQLEHAIHVFSNALYQGCTLHLESIQSLLDACLQSADREAALLLVKIFSKGYQNLQRIGVLEMKKLSEKMYAIFAMLGLGVMPNHAPVELGAYGILPSGFQLLSLSLCVNEASRQLARLEKSTDRLMKIFTLLPPRLAPDQHSSLARVAEIYARRFDSRAGQWVEEEYDPLREMGPLLVEIHRASQVTHLLAREFQYILPRLPAFGKNRRRAYMLVYRHDPIGLLYSRMAVSQVTEMIRQEARSRKRPGLSETEEGYEEESMVLVNL